MEFNYYQILGISPTAREEEIKAAYKSLAKKYHPDKHPGNSFYEEHFKKINNAYQILSDPEKRRRYDLKLLYYAQKKADKNTPPSSAASGFSRPASPKSSPKPTPTPNPEKQKMIKYSIITALAFAVFITGAIFFYNFMNRVTAKDRVKDGKILEGNKQYVAALNYYNEALDYDPDLAEAYVRRAVVRAIAFRDYNGATSDYSKAISLEEKPDYMLFFLRAKNYLKLMQYDEALKDLNTAIETNPNADSLYFYRAELNNYILKKYSLSIPDYTQAIKLNKSFQDAWYGRAIAYQNMGEFEASLKDFNELIRQYPQEGNYYYYRGFSKYNLYDKEGACQDWQLAEQNNFSGAKEAIESYCSKTE